jgi:poly-beta-1,6-N-acetyl-D-glucosamine synthase
MIAPVSLICAAGFFCAAGFIVYVLFGYPLLLDAIARRRGRSVNRASIEPTVSIVVCVYNGKAFLEQKLNSLLDLDYPRKKVQIIVVSDGSVDGTDELAAGYSTSGVSLLRIARSGKPCALNAGIEKATGEILLFTDVRQPVARDALRLLVENFADPSVGVASGELVIWKGPTREEADVGLYWRYETWIRLRLSEIDSIFGATGALYAMRRELAVPIPPTSLLDDMYLPLTAFFRGYRLIVDARAHMFDYPTGLRSEFRRKLRTLAGNYQILRTHPQLLGPGNRMWFHFWSYKFARLVLPFALLAVLIFSFGLPYPWDRILLGAQAAFYLGALADVWVGQTSPLKRLTSPVRTFVTLMAAAFCALSILFLPSARFWKTTEVKLSSSPLKTSS